MPPSVGRGATRRRAVPRSASTPSATPFTSGTRRTSAPSCGTCTTVRCTRASRSGSSRFPTCGSVDDGKSTLIGRLLHDTRAIYADQLAAVARDSARFGTTGAGAVDLALLTDGLKAEREQGITIDVAYRQFSTDRRRFI